ncbi:MAG: class I SAM-dependent methyltransferase [Acidithiobacillales bacterium]
MRKKTDPKAARGLDGLTPDELDATRRGFWDEAFAELLLHRIPADTTTIVDIGCGLAPAAHALLPRLPEARYVGVDADGQRLRVAEKLLAKTPFAPRAELRVGHAGRLPFRDAVSGFVLISMTLQHLSDPAEAVREVRRILVPRGRVVAVEPDNLCNQFYFDGRLEDLNSAFHGLFARLRSERFPADAAIGPAVAGIFERERLSIVEFFPFLLGRLEKRTAKESFGRARQVLRIVSARLPPGSAEVKACDAALGRVESSVGPERAGYYGHVVPVFVCTAEKR